MAKKPTHFVYSTLAAPVEYPTYVAGGGDMPSIAQSIVIQGGANIPDKYMRTPAGVVTPVTEDELEALRKSPVFVQHEANGFLKVTKSDTDPEKVAADMNTRDQSAPMVDEDFRAEGKEPPIVAKPQSGRRA